MHKFNLGRIVATPTALAELKAVSNDDGGALVTSLILRHVTGDWGDLGEADKAANEAALVLDEFGEYGRILSAYMLGELQHQTKIYIVTEADRSVTTVLLPSDY
jgi:hypothetical protein